MDEATRSGAVEFNVFSLAHALSLAMLDGVRIVIGTVCRYCCCWLLEVVATVVGSSVTQLDQNTIAEVRATLSWKRCMKPACI